MKSCIHCGASLPDEASFCPVCAKSQLPDREIPVPAVRRHIGLPLALLALLILFAAGAALYFRHPKTEAAGDSTASAAAGGSPQETTGGIYLTHEGHVYHVFPEIMTHEEARAFCESQGGCLAVLSSDAEEEAVRELLDPVLTDADDGLGGFWIGAYREEPGPADWMWVNGAPVSFTNWVEGNPDNSGRCVKAVIDKGHPWDDSPEELHCPVYEIDGENASLFAEQTSPIRTLSYGGHTYVLLEKQMNWDTAAALPEVLGVDGCLACFETAEEFENISPLLTSDLEKDRPDCWGGFWIGLHLGNADAFPWQWTDGEEFSRTNWAEKQPDDSGTAVKIVPAWAYAWDDCSAYERHPFLCEWDSEDEVPY